MNKKILFSALFTIAATTISTNVLAQAAYVTPAGAAGSCGDCHIGGTRSQNFIPGLFERFETAGLITTGLATTREKIQAVHALTDAQRAPVWAALKIVLNPVSSDPDTAPVVKAANKFLSITVGEGPLVIPFTVKDAENDAFDVKGSGLTLSTIPVDPVTNLANPTFDPVTHLASFTYTWDSPEAAHAGLSYPMRVYVKENHRASGRILSSLPPVVAPATTAIAPVNVVVTVWPARTNAATATVGQFQLTSAKWMNNMLTLSGTAVCKTTVANCATEMAKLSLSLTSVKGTTIGTPVALTTDASGLWTASVAATASQVPCGVIANYDGLKAKRPVISAPGATCVK